MCLNEHKLKEEDVLEWESKIAEILPELPHIAWTTSGPNGKHAGRKGYSGVSILHNLCQSDISITKGMNAVRMATVLLFSI